MKAFTKLGAALAVLEREGVRRRPEDGALRERVRAEAARNGVLFVDVSSNDYLGYASRGIVESYLGAGSRGIATGVEEGGAVSRETMASQGERSLEGTDRERTNRASEKAVDGGETLRTGAGASRLLGGSFEEHIKLETALADWVKLPAALLFSSGYAANVGLLSALPQAGDVLFSDALNHASIIDGCRLGPAEVVVYPHRDVNALAKLLRERRCRGQRWVVSETYFSMDGDSPDLGGLRAVCDRYEAGLVLDEAHALGVFGSQGAGLAAAQGISPDVSVGAFGKAVGLQGGFVAGPVVLKDWLWNKARSFVFSTAPTPNLAAQLLFHVKQIQHDDTARARLSSLATHVRARARALGFVLAPDSFGPIIPIMIGDNHQTLVIAEQLRSRGILVYPVRPPTVPPGTARLRLTLTATMSDEAIEHLINCLSECATLLR